MAARAINTARLHAQSSTGRFGRRPRFQRRLENSNVSAFPTSFPMMLCLPNRRVTGQPSRRGSPGGAAQLGRAGGAQ